MTENEAINVLKMVEAHGSLTSKAKEMAIQALAEIQEYRAIGTVEEIREIFSLCNILSNVVKDYSAIGTIEELQALKEKNEPKKIVNT